MASDRQLTRSTTTPAPIEKLIGPFQRFAQTEAAGGILLLICTAIALGFANSPWRDAYSSFWHSKLSIGLGSFLFSASVEHWVNDGLMALFFFLVGLEIKRQMLAGELSSVKRAAFPIAAALGGVVVPALIYSLINRGLDSERGWGIPMATDIAFSLGVLALLGDRVPAALKVFLTALAIVDDIAAVLVIAFFYTSHISWVSLGIALAFVGLSALANIAGVRWTLAYVLIGLVVWIEILQSGIHATIAGVLLAFTIPVKTYLNPAAYLRRSRRILDKFEEATPSGENEITSSDQHNAIYSLEQLSLNVQPTLHRMEHRLQPWVSFVIMPLFALANAGVSIIGSDSPPLFHPVAFGVIAGLVFGKPLGITLFAWLSAKIGLASKPAEVSWNQIHGAGWLGGIGFTMSLFIAGLAFTSGPFLPIAKIGILIASVAAGLMGSLLLRMPRRPEALPSS